MLKTLTDCIQAFHKDEFALLPLDSCHSVLFLFSPYAPFCYPEDSAEIDAYYFASNAAYHMAKKLLAALNEAGFEADFYRGNNVKVLAHKCGGAFGKNNLLFLEGYGSYFFITAIVISGVFEKYLKKVDMPCSNCQRCVEACPTNALGDGFCREKCLRHWHDRPLQMPSDIRKLNGKRFVGCGVCQSVCPQNHTQKLPAPTELAQLLLLKHLKKTCAEKHFLQKLADFIGANYVRKSRIESMAEIIAAENSDLTNAKT